MAGNLKEEYTDVSSNIRHYGNHQFAQFTVFVALIGGLIYLVFGSDIPLSPLTANLLKIAGLITSCLFWLMAESAMFMWMRLAERAAGLERTLGYKQYSLLPGAPKFKTLRPAKWAISMFYLFIFSFWLLSLTIENELLSKIIISGAFVFAIIITIDHGLIWLFGIMERLWSKIKEIDEKEGVVRGILLVLIGLIGIILQPLLLLISLLALLQIREYIDQRKEQIKQHKEESKKNNPNGQKQQKEQRSKRGDSKKSSFPL